MVYLRLEVSWCLLILALWNHGSHLTLMTIALNTGERKRLKLTSRTTANVLANTIFSLSGSVKYPANLNSALLKSADLDDSDMLILH